MMKCPKKGFCNICQHLDDTKDKTYPSEIETEEYNYSTLSFVDTQFFSK